MSKYQMNNIPKGILDDEQNSQFIEMSQILFHVFVEYSQITRDPQRVKKHDATIYGDAPLLSSSWRFNPAVISWEFMGTSERKITASTWIPRVSHNLVSISLWKLVTRLHDSLKRLKHSYHWSYVYRIPMKQAASLLSENPMGWNLIRFFLFRRSWGNLRGPPPMPPPPGNRALIAGLTRGWWWLIIP